MALAGQPVPPPKEGCDVMGTNHWYPGLIVITSLLFGWFIMVEFQNI